MIYPSADILENWGSRYSLVVLAAKRAKQLKSGAQPLINTHSRNPLTIALEEIAAGKVLCKVADHDILPKASQEAEVAQLLAIPTVPLEDEGAEPVDASAVLTDDTDLLLDEEEQEDEEEEEVVPPGEVDEDQHESPFVPDVDEEEEEEPLDEDAEVESPLADGEDLTVIPAEEPKPKARRGRKPKTEAVPEPVEETEDIEADSDESED